jgi:hypothetical protein
VCSPAHNKMTSIQVGNGSYKAEFVAPKTFGRLKTTISVALSAYILFVRVSNTSRFTDTNRKEAKSLFTKAILFKFEKSFFKF